MDMHIHDLGSTKQKLRTFCFFPYLKLFSREWCSSLWGYSAFVTLLVFLSVAQWLWYVFCGCAVSISAKLCYLFNSCGFTGCFWLLFLSHGVVEVEFICALQSAQVRLSCLPVVSVFASRRRCMEMIPSVLLRAWSGTHFGRLPHPMKWNLLQWTRRFRRRSSRWWICWRVVSAWSVEDENSGKANLRFHAEYQSCTHSYTSAVVWVRFSNCSVMFCELCLCVLVCHLYCFVFLLTSVGDAFAACMVSACYHPWVLFRYISCIHLCVSMAFRDASLCAFV